MADIDGHPDGDYLYDAFISYRCVDRDRKWAEWLIEALEGYRVPLPLQDQGLPPRLKKVFRDTDEAPAASDLNDAIKMALIASRFLIVVCSPYTPRSKWVEREIRMFNELGRGGRVLALLTEGEPSDSFPAPLLERLDDVVDADGARRIVVESKEPLAADVRPRRDTSARKLKRLALLRLVSAILGVKFDDLRRRDQERERRKRLIRGAVAAALILVTGVSGLAYWDMTRVKAAYFRQTISRWAVPEGLGPIDDETRAHLETSYRVATRGGKVVEVRRESSGGVLRPDDEGHARWGVHYDSDGRADVVEMFDRYDKPVREHHLERGSSTATVVVNVRRDTIAVAEAFKLLLEPTATNAQGYNVRSDITRHELTFDDRGFTIRRRYQNHYGAARHNVDGSYGQDMAYSADGLVVRHAEIDADGHELTLRSGVRAVTWTYGPHHNLLTQAWIGSDDKPFDSPEGYASYRLDHDRWGNVAAATYLSADGSVVLTKEGLARATYTYDDRGNEIERAFFGVDGKPALHRNGHAGYRQVFDERGNVVTVSYFGPDGRATFTKQGVSAVTVRYDDRDNEVERTFLGLDGQPIVGPEGYSGSKQRWNANRRRTELHYVGPNGTGVLSRDGYATIKSTYDERGREVKRAFFDVDGKPTLDTSGVAEYRYHFDDRGNVEVIEHFGIDGRLTLNKEGHARRQMTFDDRGTIREVRATGVDGKPALTSLGFATLQLHFNDRGHVTDIVLLGVDGKPASAPNVAIGAAHTRQKFDARGNRTEVAYFNAGEKPVRQKDGFAKYTSVYDARDNEIERAYFDVDDRPALHKDGNAGYRQKFDDRRNRIELIYFGPDGKPTLTSEGLARVTYSYDARGNELSRAFFDVDNKPTTGTLGYAGFRQAFDERGRLVEQSYFRADGGPVIIPNGMAKITYKYDARGNEIEQSYLGIDGRPVVHKDGNAGYRQTFDSRGNLTEMLYFGLDGKPTVTNEGLARITYSHDARGNEIRRAFFDVNDQPTTGTLGYAGFENTFDERGKKVAEAYFGVDGRPALNAKGIARATYAYDPRGNQIETTYFGVDGKWTTGRFGHARFRVAYDLRGNVTELETFGADGKPTLMMGCCARISYTYDESDRQIRVTYLDAQYREVPLEVSVLTVLRGSTAERLGLAPGDRIVSFNGNKITSVAQMVKLVGDVSGAGSRVLIIRRGSKVLTWKVAPGPLGVVLDTAPVPADRRQ